MSETTNTHVSIAHSLLSLENASSMEGDYTPPATLHHNTPGKLPTSSYEQLYADCYTQAYSRAYYLLHSHEDAEDAVQAAFCGVWKHWAHLEARGLHSYVLLATTRKAIDIIRRQRKPALSLEANEVDVCVVWDADTMIDLATARERLSPVLRSVVDLRAEGYTWQEIMDTLGITFGCLSKRFYLARVQLRKQVAA